MSESKDIVKPEASQLMPEPNFAVLKKAQEEMRTSRREGMPVQYLKKTTIGELIYGSEAVEIPNTTLWALNLGGTTNGFIAWGEKKTPAAGNPPQEISWPVGNKPHDAPSMDDLPYIPNQPWSKQVGFSLWGLKGDLSRVKFMFRNSSPSGIRAMQQVFDKCIKAVMADRNDCKNKDDAKVIPIIQIIPDKCTAKDGSSYYGLKFEVHEYVKRTDVPFED